MLDCNHKVPNITNVIIRCYGHFAVLQFSIYSAVRSVFWSNVFFIFMVLWIWSTGPARVLSFQKDMLQIRTITDHSLKVSGGVNNSISALLKHFTNSRM